MLGTVGLISHVEAETIVAGLKELAAEYASGKLVLKAEYEDVHMNVEKALEAKIGAAAAKLHTARSRNDQVALDTRLYVLEKIEVISQALAKLQVTLIKNAESNADVLMPGYTHLQRAQPVLYSHAIHAFIEMFSRDFYRFADCAKRTKVSPLGAAALAGSTLPIVPLLSAANLGFKTTFHNSLDAVSDRDFAVEFLSACCLTSTHLSQLAETLVIWASSEFSFVKFGDNVTTASSLMPNKKNPDPVELVRGKAGSVVGDLVNTLITLKALPLGYNRDLQEIKPPVIHAAATLADSLDVMNVVLDSMVVQKDQMLGAASDPYLAATDLAEYLVNKGLAFRQAHEAVSELVTHSREAGKSLKDLPLSDFKKFSGKFEEDVFQIFDPKSSITAKVSPGSTGYAPVKNALENSRRRIDTYGDETPL
jgi:argininosuccinate lyase